jgi:hypothetical protein
VIDIKLTRRSADALALRDLARPKKPTASGSPA